MINKIKKIFESSNKFHKKTKTNKAIVIYTFFLRTLKN